MADGPSPTLRGVELELDIGAVAHGGHCVARVGDEASGRVVFVRHALPGERAVVRITDDTGGSFCRGDAVRIVTASADRVPVPCPHAGPGRCGGCDWQHVSAAGQRALKTAVVREQFDRLAGLAVDVECEELPGGLLGWRTRTVYATDPQGRLGLRRHRSHEVELLEHCPLGVDGVGDHARLRQPSPRTSGLELARGEAAEVAVIEHSPAPGKAGRGRRPPDRTRLVEGPSRLGYRVMGRAFEVSAGGFWQVHPAAAQTLAEAVLVALAPQSGETALDLYAGAGLFTALLAEAVGPGGHVVGIESSRTAVADAARNLDELPWANVREGRVSAPLVGGLGLQPDLVVLDPPRTGAGAETMRAVLALCPRAVAYVACDPATLARDVAVAMSSGWRLRSLRAFDAFPMTAHVECVAIFEPSAAGAD